MAKPSDTGTTSTRAPSGTQTGWGVAYEQTGKFLRLSSKGQKVRLRLLGEPLHWKSTIIQNGKEKVLNKVAFLAVERRLNRDNSRNDRGVIFVTASSVFVKLQDLRDDHDWGATDHYDVEIERTEQPGMAYYSVTPKPGNIHPPTDAELVLVAQLNIADALAEDTQGGEGGFDPYAE